MTDAPAYTPLTHRELEILRHIAAGLTNTQTGKELHITEETVKTGVKRILRKLHADNRAHATALAYRRGLLDAGPARCCPHCRDTRAVLAELRPVRDRMTQPSPYARLYDRLADATGAGAA